jgi:hypothetical protein
MSPRKDVKPAPPVATDPRLRDLERLKREQIARLKETDMEAGRNESLSVSVMVSELDADAVRGAKIVAGGRKGHEKAHGNKATKEERWVAIARAYSKLKLQHPGWAEKELEIEIAQACGVSVRTVQKYKRYSEHQ